MQPSSKTLSHQRLLWHSADRSRRVDVVSFPEAWAQQFNRMAIFFLRLRGDISKYQLYDEGFCLDQVKAEELGQPLTIQKNHPSIRQMLGTPEKSSPRNPVKFSELEPS